MSDVPAKTEAEAPQVNSLAAICDRRVLVNGKEPLNLYRLAREWVQNDPFKKVKQQPRVPSKPSGLSAPKPPTAADEQQLEDQEHETDIEKICPLVPNTPRESLLDSHLQYFRALKVWLRSMSARKRKRYDDRWTELNLPLHDFPDLYSIDSPSAMGMKSEFPMAGQASTPGLNQLLQSPGLNLAALSTYSASPRPHPGVGAAVALAASTDAANGDATAASAGGLPGIAEASPLSRLSVLRRASRSPGRSPAKSRATRRLMLSRQPDAATGGAGLADLAEHEAPHHTENGHAMPNEGQAGAVDGVRVSLSTPLASASGAVRSPASSEDSSHQAAQLLAAFAASPARGTHHAFDPALFAAAAAGQDQDTSSITHTSGVNGNGAKS